MKRLVKCLFLTILLLYLIPACSVLERDKIPDSATIDASDSEVVSTGNSLDSKESLETSETQIETSSVATAEERAGEIISTMSLDEKVGQMFFASWVQGDAFEAIDKWKFGGIILFAPDFESRTPSEITQIIASYQEITTLPLLVGVDEEGGSVVRISKFTQFRAERFLSPQALFAQGGWELIHDDTVEKSKLLLSLGINVNLAPVCDVSTNPDDFIYKRSFGGGAEETSEYVSAIVEEMALQNIGCALKHFPGYGNNVDTHTGIALDDRSYKSFEDSDFLPFLAGIRAGAGSVMVSHNVVSCMDANYPASLSPEVHRVLREELGFDGVIMTDDLSMVAISAYAGNEEAAVLAVLAGNDMIIGSAYEEQIPAVILAVQNGEITIEAIDAAVLRILLWKIELGIVN